MRMFSVGEKTCCFLSVSFSLLWMHVNQASKVPAAFLSFCSVFAHFVTWCFCYGTQNGFRCLKGIKCSTTMKLAAIETCRFTICQTQAFMFCVFNTKLSWLIDCTLPFPNILKPFVFWPQVSLLCLGTKQGWLDFSALLMEWEGEGRQSQVKLSLMQM